MNEDLKKKKKDLMKPDWTENLQHALEKLPKEEARQIVESMNKREIYSKVNNRKYQEDYIADYLEYLWKISESAYWKHVCATFDKQEGFLWGGYLWHLEKMCHIAIPSFVLKGVLDFILNSKGTDFEAVACIIKAQVIRFNRLEEINQYISALSKEQQDYMNKTIKEMIDCKPVYDSY